MSLTIGVFDSGMGGLTVLRGLRERDHAAARIGTASSATTRVLRTDGRALPSFGRDELSRVL